MDQELNPQMERALDELATLVCQSLEGDGEQFVERQDGLLKTLVMSGHSWKSERTVMEEVERRVKERCSECAMHRGGALTSLTSKLGTKLQSLARWESNSPSEDSPAKPANISSATDA
ncbi:hypothetical protein RISK_000432 [Rhodopirellula islandica]|uniref:Uncharacterized protein n=1 Tax=Rhodopirellula islandica TaxID=595434 RepID=A0A0J1EPF1_RHOIS|nr:hypothetical protein [Rhodopirellula islandica]KLU07354.1 hypothetical protein RISK_000432 [Rhodopirellula islandica]